MKMVGYVKWLENVMDNWVIKWQNEQNMWDFDKPFPLLQWFSVRLGMSQYSSLGMSQWIYTTPGAARSVALMMKSPVTEIPPGWEPGQVNRVVHCFPPSNSSFCHVCVRERESAADRCPRMRQHRSPGHIFALCSQWWRLRVRGSLWEDQPSGWLDLDLSVLRKWPPEHMGDLARRHTRRSPLYTDSLRLRLSPLPTPHPSPACSLLMEAPVCPLLWQHIRPLWAWSVCPPASFPAPKLTLKLCC